MARPLKVREQVVAAYPEPYIRQSVRVEARRRGRPRKNGRPKKDSYEKVRASPSKRVGQRWVSVSVPEEAYYMLKEVAAFYKVGMGSYMYSIIIPAFDHAYQESLTLQRIAANKKKAQDEIPDRDVTPRRTHF